MLVSFHEASRAPPGGGRERSHCACKESVSRGKVVKTELNERDEVCFGSAIL